MATSEHLREMFQLLDFNQLMICEQVCISWNSFITSNPQLYWFKYPQKFYKSYVEQWRDLSFLEIFSHWYRLPIISITPKYECSRIYDIRSS